MKTLLHKTSDRDRELFQLLDLTRQASHRRFGKSLDLFLPGMFTIDHETGPRNVISITGDHCDLQCEHCRGRLLKNMIPALDPGHLVDLALELEHRGVKEILISGGSDPDGRLPWPRFTRALETIRRRTSLFMAVHAGYLDQDTAGHLKNAGVDQALVDVIGDDDTARQVYHLKNGAAPVWQTLDALAYVGLEAVPHLVAGLHFGRLKGEERAIERLQAYAPERLVLVVIRPLPETGLEGITPPPPEDVARLFIAAREWMPHTRQHLGCVRPGGLYRRRLDRLAVRAGINALAVPSPEACDEAEALGLKTIFHKSCCSLAGRPEKLE